MRLIDANCSALTALGTKSNKQLSPLGNKKTGLGARWGRITRDPVIMVSIFLFENFDLALAGKHIHSVPNRMVEGSSVFPGISPAATCLPVSVSKTSNCGGFHTPRNRR